MLYRFFRLFHTFVRRVYEILLAILLRSIGSTVNNKKPDGDHSVFNSHI